MPKPEIEELQKSLSLQLNSLIISHSGQLDNPLIVDKLLDSVKLFPFGGKLPEYLFIYDYIKNEYSWVSNSFPNMTGFSINYLMGKSAEEGVSLLYNEDDIQFMGKLLDATYKHYATVPIAEKLHFSIEVSARYIHAEGRIFWTRQHWSPLMVDENGGVILALGQVVDLSTLVGSINHYYHIKLIKDGQTRILESLIRDNECIKQLSSQEAVVLREVAQGFTTKQIANRLSISFHTVESHRKNIIKKLNAENIQKALVIALTRGLI